MRRSPPLSHVAGFVAVNDTLPFPTAVGAEMQTRTSGDNGMLVTFGGEKFHCVAAEPDATFLHVAVNDGRREVAFETAVLGRLRGGYRVFQMRSTLGTRIEICFLFVHISFGIDVRNQWLTARQLRLRGAETDSRRSRDDQSRYIEELRQQIALQRQTIQDLEEKSSGTALTERQDGHGSLPILGNLRCSSSGGLST